MTATHDDDARFQHDRLQKLHEQVLENWTRQGGAGDGREFDVLVVPAVRATLVIVYVVIIVVGVFGNGLVVAVAATHTARSSSAAKNSLQVNNALEPDFRKIIRRS